MFHLTYCFGDYTIFVSMPLFTPIIVMQFLIEKCLVPYFKHCRCRKHSFIYIEDVTYLFFFILYVWYQLAMQLFL